MTDERRPQTSLGTADLHSIIVGGRDLPSELMGEVDLADMIFMLVAGRLPSQPESRLFNATLVSLCDHGVTAMAIVSRLTLTSAPESVQGAMAAGLLGVGDLLLGVVENVARMLAEALDGVEEGDDDALEGLARNIVARSRDRGEHVPGIGHRFHKEGDPRTARLYEIADEEGLLGPHLRLLRLVHAEAQVAYGRRLPLNGAGAAGAVFADLGFDHSIVRGFAVLSRAAGLIGQLWEERQRPMGRDVLELLRREVEYVPPAG